MSLRISRPDRCGLMLLPAVLVLWSSICLGDEASSPGFPMMLPLDQRIEAAREMMTQEQIELVELRSVDSEDEATREQNRKEIERLEQLLAIQAEALKKLLMRQEAALRAEQDSSTSEEDDNALDALKAQLVERDDALVEMKIRLQAAYDELRESDRERELPKLENATLKVFRLKYLQATMAAQTITSILGEREVRVAPDDRANALVVAADEESAKLIEALLMQLDVDSAEPDNGEKPAVVGSQARSLLLRTYWLADGLPQDEGEDASQFLPVSVLKAMAGLGLNEPRLVCQTVNSISRAGDDQPPSSFETNVPAVVLKQQARLKCGGLIRALHGDRADIEARIEVQSPMFTSELSGSLAMPLGHYMVLGTANSVSFDPAQLSGGGMAPGMEGMGMPMGRGGDAFADATVRGGGRGGEFGGGGGPGAAVDPATGMPAGVADAQYNTSHFAFVVQINEAESFAEEK